MVYVEHKIIAWTEQLSFEYQLLGIKKKVEPGLTNTLQIGIL